MDFEQKKRVGSDMTISYSSVEANDGNYSSPERSREGGEIFGGGVEGLGRGVMRMNSALVKQADSLKIQKRSLFKKSTRDWK